MDKQQQQPKKKKRVASIAVFPEKRDGTGTVGNIYKNKRLAWFKSRNPTICEEIVAPSNRNGWQDGNGFFAASSGSVASF